MGALLLEALVGSAVGIGAAVLWTLALDWWMERRERDA